MDNVARFGKCKICGNKKSCSMELFERICGKTFPEILENFFFHNFKLKSGAEVNYVICEECVLAVIQGNRIIEKVWKAFKSQMKNAVVRRKLVTANPKYACEHCEFKTTVAKTFMRHMRQQHQVAAMFKCSECPAAYKTKWRHTHHIQNAHNAHELVLGHQCSICSKSYSNRGTLDRHMKKIHSTENIEGNSATKKSDGNESVAEAYNDYTFGDDDVTKKDWNEDSEDEVAPKLHVAAALTTNGNKEPENEREYVNCSLCDYQTHSAKKLRKHLKHQHAQEENIDNMTTESAIAALDPQPLPQVKKAKSRKRLHSTSFGAGDDSQLDESKKTSLSASFACTVADCSKTYSTKSLLQAHKTNKHLTAEEKHNVCVVCGKKFKHIEKLRAHMDTAHMVSKLKVCPSCGAQFRSMQTYETHIFSEKCSKSLLPCQIPKCDRRFVNVNQLRDHMNKTHMKNAPETEDFDE